MTMPQRYINQRVLQYITWPQYLYGCSLAALTCVVNYLYAEKIGVQSPREVAKAIGQDAEEIGWDGGPSNRTLIRWFDRFVTAHGLKGKGRIEFGRKDVEDFSENTAVCQRLDAIVRDNNQLMVLGESNHFLLIAGFFEAAEDPDEVYESDAIRWLVLADHNPEDIVERLPESLRFYAREVLSMLAERGFDLRPILVNTPVRCRRWRDMRQDMIHRGHKILVFSR